MGVGMQTRAVAIAAACALLAGACAPDGADYTIRVELWAGWVESESAPGACEGADGFAEFYNSAAEVSLLNADGEAVSRTTLGGGYVDNSLVGGAKPSSVCAWEIRFTDVPELLRYRILWPDGEVGRSRSPYDLERLSYNPLVLKAGWTPNAEQ